MGGLTPETQQGADIVPLTRHTLELALRRTVWNHWDHESYCLAMGPARG